MLAVLRKQYKMVFIGLLLGAFFFLLFPRLLKYLPLPRQTEKIGLIGQYEISQLPDFILKDISTGLTLIDASGRVKPALAESWKVEDEGKTYIFNLKENSLIWHDGKQFSPSDINYNFKDVNFEINNQTMTFTLKEAFAPFPSILSKPLFKKGLVGLGDYQVKKIEMQGKYVKSIYLVPFKNSVQQNRLYRFYRHEKELKTGFNLGEVDIIKGIFDLNDLSLGPRVQVNRSLLQDAYLGIFFNTEKAPFSEKTFRQALAYAVPKGDKETRALGPLNPNSWAYNPDVKPYERDIARAKALLGENEVEYQKIIISTLPQYETIANLVKDSWSEIGIESEIHLVSFIPQDYDVLIVAQEIPQDPDQYHLWHSTQRHKSNIANFNNTRIDKLLEDGRKTVGEDKRKDIYFDFQRFLIEESPVVFLSHPTTYTLTRL